jgi:hypothetical protein
MAVPERGSCTETWRWVLRCRRKPCILYAPYSLVQAVLGLKIHDDDIAEVDVAVVSVALWVDEDCSRQEWPEISMLYAAHG